jgi:hypothetical protein
MSMTLASAPAPSFSRESLKLRRTAFQRAACAASVAFLVACTKETVYVQPDGASPASLPDGGAASADGSVPELTPKAECERYLTCVNQHSPGEGGAAVTLYGDASPCWKGSTTDAQQCGDACRTARVAVANEGTRAPACGCTSDTECPMSFCAPEGACLSAEWGLALTECKAVQAKALGPSPQQLQQLPPGAVACWAIEALRCDAIKSLVARDGSREDAKGHRVSETSLRTIYKCGMAADAKVAFVGTTSDPLPADAPGKCKTPGATTAILRIDCTDSESSPDLLEFHELK